MKRWVSRRVGFGLLAVGWLFSHVPAASGFALLGPFAPWMKPSLGYHCWDDIGGPMNLGEEYRWTVPVLSYGFDQSFIEAFGQPGVDAVEQAIQILNDLPPASQISLTSYPFDTLGVCFRPASQNHFDLKSAALALLVEQLGLAESRRYAWTLGPKDFRLYFDPSDWCVNADCWWTGSDSDCTNYISRRSFDPQHLEPTSYLNSILISFAVFYSGAGGEVADAFEIPVPPPFIF